MSFLENYQPAKKKGTWGTRPNIRFEVMGVAMGFGAADGLFFFVLYFFSSNFWSKTVMMDQG